MSEEKADLQKAIWLILGLTYNGNLEEKWAREIQDKYKINWPADWQKKAKEEFPDIRTGGSYQRRTL